MDTAYHEEITANRTWKRLAILKRATLLSYCHTMLTAELFDLMKYDSKYDLIDVIIENGMADDCLQEFKTY